jgi:hypothetical protein
MFATTEPMISTETTRPRAPKTEWPRISLITPVLNSGKYLEQTIRSVLEQAYPNLEYFIIDGGSTDGTLDVIRNYENQISGWISEPDNGMYDAINKGFARTSGEIMGWISATDMLHPGALCALGNLFLDLPGVEWVTGRRTWFDEEGRTTRIGGLARWSRYRFLAGANRYIQQESTFWRRRLWEKAGGYVDASRRMASDFELWVRFFRYAQLYSADVLIGGFRYHKASLGLQELERCHEIHDQIIEGELDRTPWQKSLRLIRGISQAVKPIPKVEKLWRQVVIKSLYWLPGPSLSPTIKYTNTKWRT